MNDGGRSDGRIVPRTPANKGEGYPRESHAASTPAEQVEERRSTKGNSLRGPRDRTQRRAALQAAGERIRQAASV